MPSLLRAAFGLVLILGLAACTGVRLLPAPPEDAATDAAVPGYPVQIRTWGDVAAPDGQAALERLRSQIAQRIADEGQAPNNGRADVLVLSGGGSDGAFGAGLLNGWTDRGGRPEFTLVTGISTGALIAPFAFLGPEFDGELERFYTNTRTEDVVDFQIFQALLGNVLGLSDTAGLRQTLADVVTDEFVDRIAAEHNKGRRLLVGTTNLDAQRPVTWDIGAIANTDSADRAQLIRSILLASASIPGAFPPVEFVVEANGQRFSEMHVDGGVTRQLFFIPTGFLTRQDAWQPGDRVRLGTVYVVRNTKLAPDYQEIEAGIVPIAARSISTLIKTAGVSDAALIEAQAEREGFGLALTAVPESFDAVEQELFDPAYMRMLYDLGFELGLAGEPWEIIRPRPE